jgi:hypothetical protein
MCREKRKERDKKRKYHAQTGGEISERDDSGFDG